MPSGAAPAARNVELEARDPDPARSLAAARAIGAADRGVLGQTDTYFVVPHGRLKLREAEGSAALIAYHRADEPDARTSEYHIVGVPDPAALRAALAPALGILVVVRKARRLLLWREVRIHLDAVEGLGRFLELEAVAPPASDLSAEHRHVQALRAALGIADDQLVARSYADELIDRGQVG